MSRHLMAKMRNYTYAAAHLAAPQFDWRHTPGYNTSGTTVDHHTAPLENGDSLHVYRLDNGAEPGSYREFWLHEIRPHDMPLRFPIPSARDTPAAEIENWRTKVNDVGDFSRRNVEVGFPSRDSAMEAVEQRYKDQAPKWQRHHHTAPALDGGIDYDQFFKPHDLADDDYGDIFGDRSP